MKLQARAVQLRMADKDDSAIVAEASELAETLAGQTTPSYPEILADDITPEQLVHSMRAQGERLAIVSAEGGVFDIIAGRYSGNVPNLDVYLKGYSGEALKVGRRSSDRVIMRRPALTMALAVQPEVLQGL